MNIQIKSANHLTLTHSILIGMLTASCCTFAQQANHPSQLTQQRQMSEGQRLLDQYTSSKKSLLNVKNLFSNISETVEAIHAKGLPKTAKNVETVSDLLASSNKKEEKIALLRLIGSLYTYDNQSGSNHLILKDLRLQINSNEKAIAVPALLTFSRLGYVIDSVDVLKHAYDRKILGDDGYFGELAHLLPYMPGADQNKPLDTVKAGNNAYAKDILTSSFTQASIIKSSIPTPKRI